MTKIWKFRVPDNGVIKANNCVIHKVIHAGFDPQQELCIWTEVSNSDFINDYVIIHTVMTGMTVPSMCTYINTVMRNDIVAHIYVQNKGM